MGFPRPSGAIFLSMPTSGRLLLRNSHGAPAMAAKHSVGSAGPGRPKGAGVTRSVSWDSLKAARSSMQPLPLMSFWFAPQKSSSHSAIRSSIPRSQNPPASTVVARFSLAAASWRTSWAYALLPRDFRPGETRCGRDDLARVQGRARHGPCAPLAGPDVASPMVTLARREPRPQLLPPRPMARISARSPVLQLIANVPTTARWQACGGVMAQSDRPH